MTMKIAIDARTINRRQSGVGFYVSHLLKTLGKIDKKNSYYLIINEQQPKDFPSPSPPSWQYLRTWFSHENHLLGDLWELLYLPLRLHYNGIDIFHGPAYLIPPVTTPRLSTIVTIHDLVAFSHPETIPLKYKYYMRLLLKIASQRATCIIVDSHSVKDELMERLKVPEYKIRVVPLGVSPVYRRIEDQDLIEEIKAKFGISERYILQVGNIEPRKNLLRLFKAFHIVKKDLAIPLQLVNVGKRGWLYEEIFGLIERYGLQKDIIFTGYVSEEELVLLYNGAEVLVYPSLYEGFGLPLLEAMRCGTPVITSKISSMPEVVADAAILVDPYNIEEMAEAIERLLTQPALREGLIEAGLARVGLFSWERTAEQTLRIYEELYQR